jgi:histidinol-phosphate aminotransferase
MKKDVKNRIRSIYKSFKPYVPIEPTDVLSKRIKISADSIVKLDGNENPYGCSDKVIKALAKYKQYNIYPDPEQRELRRQLSKYTGVDDKCIVAGAGSDDLIELICRLFLDPDDKVINCPPTFGMYKFCTELYASKIVSVNRKEDYSLDIKNIIKQVESRTKLIFLASPNNPSGNMISLRDIKLLLESDLVVVIDEAYGEFSNVTCMDMVEKYSNLIILRTFSKWAGLAGLRVGYGIFPENLVSYIMQIKQPYNVNIAAQIAALESLKDVENLKSTVAIMVKERQRLFKKLKSLDWLQPYPSEANFILCRVLKGNAVNVCRRLQKTGIFIRYFDTPGLEDCIRISVGKPEHTDKIIETLRDM